MTITLPSLSAGSAGSAYSAAVVNAAINQQKTNIENIINRVQAIDGLLHNTSTYTLSSDTLSMTGKPSVIVVDTEAAAATDNLSTISNGTAYTYLFLKAANAGRVITVNHNVGNIKLNGGANVVLSSTAWLMLFYDGTQWTDVFIPPPSTVRPQPLQGRLTLTSGLPVTTADVTAATNIYYTPYGGNKVTLYNLTTWVEYTLTELTFSTAGLAANLPRDMFLHYNGSALELLSVGWTNTTTRATALTKQDGVLVLSSDKTYRYIGTFCTTGTVGQTEDSVLNRLVYNYYNRVGRTMQVTESTDTWTYATATWRSLNNSTANRVAFMVGVAEGAIGARAIGGALSATSAVGLIGIGLDSTSAPCGIYTETKNAANTPLMAEYRGTPAAGFHYLQVLEYASAATITFYGDNGAGVAMQTGMIAEIAA